MSSKTKIVVLRMKEIIYTAIFAGFGILLILLLFIMFRPKEEEASASAEAARYIPGVYSTALTLGSQEVSLEVAVNADSITSISMVPLSDAVATMYPLVQPSLNSLTEQICATQSFENLTYSEDTRYTSQVLLKAIERAVEKARVK